MFVCLKCFQYSLSCLPLMVESLAMVVLLYLGSACLSVALLLSVVLRAGSLKKGYFLGGAFFVTLVSHLFMSHAASRLGSVSGVDLRMISLNALARLNLASFICLFLKVCGVCFWLFAIHEKECAAEGSEHPPHTSWDMGIILGNARIFIYWR